MKSKFITDPQDSSDSFGFLDTAGAEVYANLSSPAASFSPPAARDVGSQPSSDPVEIPSTALVSEAVQASGAQSGATTTLALTSGGITINLLFDAAAMAAPASFRAGIQQAASLLTAAISDKIIVNIKIDYSGTGGGAAAGPDNGQYVSYSTVRSDLVNNATPGDPVFNALPSGSTLQTQSNVAVWNAQLKLWGILGANDTTTDDGSATFATDINPNLLVGVALHELTHAMGRVPYGPPYGSQPDIFDFFRFTTPNNRLINGASTATAAYFSVDGGNTKLADYGQTSDPSDFLNSGIQGSNDPFNEFYGGGTLQSLSAVDKTQLDALGFHTTVAQNGFVVAATTSQAIQGGSAVTLLSGPPTITVPASATLSSATIKIANTGSSAVTGDELYINGQQSGTVDGGLVAVSWNNVTKSLSLVGAASIAAYQTLLSEITYQDSGTDSSTGSHPLRTTTWTVSDGTANITTTSQIAIERAPVMTAANVALNSGLVTVAASSLFTASDPDGDAITTYAFKDTGNGHFVLNGVAQANNQEIDVTAAQLSQLTYQNAIGTDSLQVRGNDGTLWSSWQSFTITGAVATVIETAGSTSLVQVGSDYFLNPVGGGTGPELFYSGTPVTAGMFGAWWAPVGAEQVGSGYDVAWLNSSNGLFSIWSIDGNGNYITNLASNLSGTSSTLESYETILHQDLNGDHIIGPPPLPTIVIETAGSTSLVQVGSDYFLNPVGGGTGPELFYSGAPVTAGMFGAWWAPVGEEQVGSGYDVAWLNSSNGLFSIWSIDGNGNYITNLASNLSGTSSTLESYETILHQDLNGDHIIGPPPLPTIVIETAGSTSLVQVGSDYFLNPVGGGTGPELFYSGAPVTAGMFGAWWAPVGAEQVGSGYDVAWLNSSNGLFSIWSIDSNGNYITNLASNLSGTSSTLESYETILHQDLNGDHIIGPPPLPTIVIETAGSTSLVQIGSDYFLNPVGGGTGPELFYSGAPVTAGMFGAWWAPVGAEQVGSGYDVAWLNSSNGLFSIWSIDGNGNYITNLASNLSGTSSTLESYETILHQDLNGDGVIGIYATSGTTLLINGPLSGTSATIGTAATLELTAADSGSVTFQSSTGMLRLDHSGMFSGALFNFGGNGSLSGSDQIDLKDINFSSVHDNYANGALTVTDRTNTALLSFNGSYTLANFEFANDGNGGTIIYDPPAPTSNPTQTSSGHVIGVAGGDTFDFNSNFGQKTINNFDPNHDTIQVDHGVFADVAALMAHTSDNNVGNAVIAANAHDTITIVGVTTDTLQHHPNDFIIG